MRILRIYNNKTRFGQRSNSPQQKGEEKGTSFLSQRLLELLLGTGEKWPISDRRVTSNYARNNCGTHFGTSSLFVSKVYSVLRWKTNKANPAIGQLEA